MKAAVGNVVEPRPYFAVGQGDVDEIGLCRSQRIVERFTQVAVKSLDFPLRLRAIGCAEFNADSVVLDEVQPCRLIPMESVAVRVAFDDDRFGIVAEYVQRNAAEVLQRAFEAGHQGYAGFIVGELNVGIARKAQFSRERAQRQNTSPKNNEVDLQLLSRIGFKALNRLERLRRPNLAQKLFELRDTALIALSTDSRSSTVAGNQIFP